MTSKSLKLAFFLVVFTFISFGLIADGCFAQQDSADVAIIYKTADPGHYAEVEVKLKNPMPVYGFQFNITLSNPDLFDFHTDSIVVDIVPDTIWKDTCTVGPDTLHGDSCFVVDSIRWLELPVRYCRIDTVGSLISDFSIVECHGEVGDTSLPDCKWITAFGMAEYGEPIEPSNDYRTLFKFGVDVFCLCDSVSDRKSSFYIFPSVHNWLAGDDQTIPFRYHQGDLRVLWGEPGDANNDGVADIGDVVFIINFLFRYGDPACVVESWDVNGDGGSNCEPDVGDVAYLLNWLYRNGDPPGPGCWLAE